MVQLESKFKINILWSKIWGTLHFNTKLLNVFRRFNISVYDASHLVLADKLKIGMVTGDKRFFNTVKAKVKNVIWIEDFGQ